MRIAFFSYLGAILLGLFTGSSLGFVLINLLLAIVFFFDYRMTRQHMRYQIKRVEDNSWQQHQQEQMRFNIVNEGSMPLVFSGIEDLIVNKLVGNFHTFSGKVQSLESNAFYYLLTPLRRGDYTLGKVVIKYESYYRLWQFHEQWSLPYQLQVYPNLAGLKQFSLNKLQNRRQLEALKALRLKSLGREFDSLRDYVDGDDYRGINWMATARQGYPVVNTYQLENNQKIYLMMDCGRSQRYQIDGIRQIDAAIETAVLLSHRISESGDQFGMTAFDHRILAKVPCGRGRSWAKRTLEALYRLEPSLYQAHYGDAYMETLRKEHHRSIVMWFTDFDQKREAERFLNQLSKGLRKHVHVVFMMTRNDYLDLSTAPYDEEDIYHKGVAIQLLEERDQIAAYLRAHGVFVSICSPHQLPTMALQHYLLAKAKLQGG